MKLPYLPPETIIIDRWTSTCNACGFGASKMEKSHITRLDYGDHDGKGCGVEYKYVSSNYIGIEVDRIRPDLEYISMWV